MMNISQAMKNHLSQPVTTLSTCWHLKRLDNKEFFFTDNVEDIVFKGNIYNASSGFDTSNIKSSSDGAVDNLEITSFLSGVSTSITDVIDSEFITEEDVRKGIWDTTDVEIFMVNREDLNMGTIPLRKGTTGQIKLGRLRAETELRSTKQPLAQNVVDLYHSTCSARFSDAKCNFDNKTSKTKWLINGSVTSIINQHSFLDSSLNQTNSTNSSGIQNISAGTTTYIQSNSHPFSSGDIIRFSGISGSMGNLNGMTASVGFIDANTFQVAINSSGFMDVVIESGNTIYKNTSYSNSFNATYSGSNWNTNGGNYVGGGSITTAVASEYFQGGVVTFTSGNNKGLSAEVKNYYPQYVFLATRLVGKVQIGDTYTILAGCDKLASTCHDRFDNIDCFRGFNLIPGNDNYLSGK